MSAAVDRNLRFVDEPAGDRHLLLVVPPRKDSSREDDVVDGYPGRPPAEVVEFQDGLVASFFLRPPAPHELAYTPCEIALDFLQIAAQERVAKASKAFYSDTGLMALLCRHDRVLWLVNMTSAGERQHYALSLLSRLFKHLPPGWNIGLLYDIACQIARSIIKVRFHSASLVNH